MLPQTGEIVMKWLPFVSIAIILLVILFVFVKLKKGNKEESTKTENLNATEEQRNDDKNSEE